jgi:hypothetical protein
MGSTSPWHQYVDRTLEALDIDFTEAAGRTKRREVVRTREILFVLGVERYGLRVKGLASALGVRYDTASLWGRRGAKRRAENDGFRSQIDHVDSVLASSEPSKRNDPNPNKE